MVTVTQQTSGPIEERKWPTFSIALIALLLSMIEHFQLGSFALQYWLSGDSSYAFFNGDGFHDGLLALTIFLSGILGIVAPLMLMVRAMLPGIAVKVEILAALLLCVFAISYMVFQGYYFSNRNQLGTIGLGLHSGSAYGLVALLVVYRYFESLFQHHSLNRQLFTIQISILALSPWLYQVGYGLWFLVLGHAYDGIYPQQLLISFGHYLLPMAVAYAYITLIVKDGDLDNSLFSIDWLLAAIAVCFMVLGLMGYHGSSVQPSIF